MVCPPYCYLILFLFLALGFPPNLQRKEHCRTATVKGGAERTTDLQIFFSKNTHKRKNDWPKWPQKNLKQKEKGNIPLGIKNYIYLRGSC
jgi:hypothetical protein